MTLPLLALLACDAVCPDCPDCPPPPLALEGWEVAVVTPAVESLRGGVRLFGEQAWGVCGGATECDAFLGPTPGELAPGAYIVRAELKAPDLGEWKVRFSARCTTAVAGGAPATQEYEKEYAVRPTRPDRGYRLSPLWRIESPFPQGARTCELQLVPLRPDGQEGTPWTASYSTPAPGSEP